MYQQVRELGVFQWATTLFPAPTAGVSLCSVTPDPDYPVTLMGICTRAHTHMRTHILLIHNKNNFKKTETFHL